MLREDCCLALRHPGKREMQQSPSEGLTFIWEYHNAGKPGLRTAGRQILERGALSHLLLKEGFTYKKDTVF